MKVVPLAVILLLAGCVHHPPVQGSMTTGGATAPTSSVSNATGSQPPAVDNASAPPPQTWYLHKQKTCEGGTGNLCNCGSERNYMVPNTTKGDCDGGGNRGPFPADCRAECYPADAPFPAYPAGTQVKGAVYLTDDGVDTMDVQVTLTVNGTAVGGALVKGVTITGLGGATAQEVLFSFQTTAAVFPGLDPGRIEFRLHVEAKESWFLASDPTSNFTIG